MREFHHISQVIIVKLIMIYLFWMINTEQQLQITNPPKKILFFFFFKAAILRWFKMLMWLALRTGNILQRFHLPLQNFIEQSQWKCGRYIRVLIAKCVTWYSSSITLKNHDASSAPWGDIVEWKVRFEFLNRAASITTAQALPSFGCEMCICYSIYLATKSCFKAVFKLMCVCVQMLTQ